MMLLTLTPRKANDAALKPVILAAEKLGTKVARSPISRGAAWLMSDESTADTATGVVWRLVSRRVAVTMISESPASPTPASAGSVSAGTAGGTSAVAWVGAGTAAGTPGPSAPAARPRSLPLLAAATARNPTPRTHHRLA